MIRAVKIGGTLVIANNFTSVIQFHLPHNFHLKYTFTFFAQKMGLEKLGRLEGTHATIYKKQQQSDFIWSNLRKYERISKSFYPVIETVKPIIRPIKRILR